MKYLLSLLILFTASFAVAKPGMMPMRNFHAPAAPHGPYKDSVQFKAAFEELYPYIRPTPNVKERAKTMLGRMGPMLRARGIDSAIAYDTAMKAIDPTMDKQILFDAYRAEFSAEELKPLTTFFKTPAGKHYLEVEDRVSPARNGEIDRSIAQTIYHAIQPMMKPMQPPQGGMPRPPVGPMTHPVPLPPAAPPTRD